MSFVCLFIRKMSTQRDDCLKEASKNEIYSEKDHDNLKCFIFNAASNKIDNDKIKQPNSIINVKQMNYK